MVRTTLLWRPVRDAKLNQEGLAGADLEPEDDEDAKEDPLATEAGARVLTGDGHGGRAYSLTGPQELSLDEVATVFSEVLGRPVRYARPSLVGFFRHARRAGAPAPLAAIMTSIGVVARLGYAKGVDPDLFRLLGRTPRSLTQFVRDHRAVWSS